MEMKLLGRTYEIRINGGTQEEGRDVVNVQEEIDEQVSPL